MRGAMKFGVVVWAMASAIVIGFSTRVGTTGGVTDAPTGFDGLSNGFAEEYCANQQALRNSPYSPEIPAAQCNFDAAVNQFAEIEGIEDGIGPVFNATSCGGCHAVPVLGGSTQVTEKRAGFFDGYTFFEHPGGSLIHDRAIDPSIQELTIPSETNVVALRSSLSILGDGFVEAVGNPTLEAIAANQPSSMRGQFIYVDVFEKPGELRGGRFGHKDQQASLLSFAADAYLNEMGVTSLLQPDENTSNGNSVAAFDGVPDPDNDGVDVEQFALFMRSTKAPPRDPVRAATSDAIQGSGIFDDIGCGVCHTREMVTLPPGTLINQGTLTVSNALGNKRIKPFSDFLLHNVGTGDGIVQNGGAATRNKIRTAPLWGLRTRGRFMHDAATFNLTDAILRHGGQASQVRDNFKLLNGYDQRKLIAFLLSL
ncbi:MAG: hypothetical protein DMF88_21915 [Acidobacteria bacterium]|nr:MAG: hypothetical protein DMF88_21915 [Acidobacteriota bacterium]